jgi:hypothetical protein
MVHINESTKKVFLFLAVALCVYLVFVFSSILIGESDNELEILELEEEIELEEEVVGVVEEDLTEEINEWILSAESIKPDHIQKGSMKIKLDNVYLEEDSERDYVLYFDVMGEDMFLDEEMSKQSGNFFFRSPFSWYSNLQYHKDNTKVLLICDYNSEGRFWNTTYCINLGELTENYFGQTIRLVYTDKSPADIENFTPLALMRQERTFVFEVILPKEFYEKIE